VGKNQTGKEYGMERTKETDKTTQCEHTHMHKKAPYLPTRWARKLRSLEWKWRDAGKREKTGRRVPQKVPATHDMSNLPVEKK